MLQASFVKDDFKLALRVFNLFEVLMEGRKIKVYDFPFLNQMDEIQVKDNQVS